MNFFRTTLGLKKSQQGRSFFQPSQKIFPISFKPKVAIAKFIGKMQKKSLVLWKINCMNEDCGELYQIMKNKYYFFGDCVWKISLRGFKTIFVSWNTKNAIFASGSFENHVKNTFNNHFFLNPLLWLQFFFNGCFWQFLFFFILIILSSIRPEIWKVIYLDVYFADLIFCFSMYSEN